MEKQLIIPKFQEPESVDEAKQQILSLGKSLHEHAYILGRLLVWIRDKKGTTQFENWLENNVWFGERTAYHFMAFSKKCDGEQKLLEYHPRKDATATVAVPPPLPKGKYKVIYADPPWQYGQEQHSKEEQETVLNSHYPSMATEEICNLPIEELAGENSVLFLWTTSPKLFEAKQVIDAWGFTYKSSMVWDKVKHNVGYYVSVRHEFLLICTKGSCLPDSHKLLDSVVTEERTEHSKKPDIFYDIIEQMYKGKKIELFARPDKKRKGWDYWGNQANGI